MAKADEQKAPEETKAPDTSTPNEESKQETDTGGEQGKDSADSKEAPQLSEEDKTALKEARANPDVLLPEDLEEDGGKKSEETKEGDDSEKKTEEDDKPDENKSKETDDSEAKRKEEARKAYRERQKAKQQVQEDLHENFAPKTEQELVEQEGLSEADAKVEALRQEMEFKEATNFVSDLNAGLRQDARQVREEFPIFREKNADGTDNPDYDPEFTAKVQARYQRVARLETMQLADGRTVYVNAEEPLYDFYKEEAESYQRGQQKGTASGEAKGTQDALKMMSRAESPASSSQTTSEEDDPFLKGFNRVK